MQCREDEGGIEGKEGRKEERVVGRKDGKEEKGWRGVGQWK